SYGYVMSSFFQTDPLITYDSTAAVYDNAITLVPVVHRPRAIARKIKRAPIDNQVIIVTWINRQTGKVFKLPSNISYHAAVFLHIKQFLPGPRLPLKLGSGPETDAVIIVPDIDQSIAIRC